MDFYGNQYVSSDVIMKEYIQEHPRWMGGQTEQSSVQIQFFREFNLFDSKPVKFNQKYIHLKIIFIEFEYMKLVVASVLLNSYLMLLLHL
jgi:hypothetical protein